MTPTIQPATPPCPECRGSGTLHAIGVTREARTLSYQCEACDHEWTVTEAQATRRWIAYRFHGSLVAK